MRTRFFGAASLVGFALLLFLSLRPVTWMILGLPARGPLLAPPRAEPAIFARLHRPITLRAGGRNWRLTPAELGLHVTDVTQPDLWQRVAGLRTYDAVLTWDRQQLAESLAPVLRMVQRLPQGATWEIEPGGATPTIRPEVDGQALDVATLIDRLEQQLSGAGVDPKRVGIPGATPVVDVPLTRLPASPTAQDLAGRGVDTLLATFTTRYDPTIPRGENVAKAAGLLDAYWWDSNTILSYNGLLGPIRATTGWQEAWVIVGEQLVRGVGGGACQVATTLYDAALLAGLEVVERHPHNLAVSYIAPGQDATVAPPRQDLKLRNNTGHPIYIRTRIDGGAVTVWLYGHGTPGRRVEVVSRVVSRLPVVERELTVPGLAPGERKLLQEGTAGVVVEAERQFYQENQLVRTERLSRDTYPMVPTVIGTSPQPQG